MTSPHAQGSTAATDKVRVVQNFLAACERLDYDAALALCADDVVWINAPVTSAKNKRQLEKAMRSMFGDVTLFRVEDMEIYERPDGVVFTDRFDVIEGGGLKMRIAVQGDFEVKDGLVTRWVDRFSWSDSTRQVLRSLPAVVRFQLAKRRRR